MYQPVLDFWFKEMTPAQWWTKDTELDQLITHRFSDLHQQAVRCELYEWREHAHGRLAEIILLDQFSRNMYRDSSRAFSNDPLALALAQEAISAKADSTLSATERSVLYMPFMHSESLKIHQVAEHLFKTKGLDTSYTFELKHKEIIARFGRYPHRNRLLGRTSTPEELAFLKQPGSSF